MYPLPATLGQRSKDRGIIQIAYLGLQSCLWLIWSSDLGCVSYRTCGYRTRKPLPCLGGLHQRALHRNGFADIQLDAAAWFTERGGTRGVVLGTSQ